MFFTVKEFLLSIFLWSHSALFCHIFLHCRFEVFLFDSHFWHGAMTKLKNFFIWNIVTIFYKIYHKTMLFYSTNFRRREGFIDMVKTLFWGQRAYTGACPVIEIAALKTILPKLEINHQQKTLSIINTNCGVTFGDVLTSINGDVLTSNMSPFLKFCR